MRILIIGLVVLALSVAGISTYLIQTFSTEEAIGELEKKAGLITYHTLVATLDLQPGDVLSNENMVWREWPDGSLDKHYITVDDDSQRRARSGEVLGSVVRRMIQAGEPILASKIFKADKAGFMSGILDKGMRAVSIAVTPNTGVSGFILPGDRVDVLLVHNKGAEALKKTRRQAAKGKDEQKQPEQLTVLRTTTETVLQNILVLATDQFVGRVEGMSVPAKTLTLQLTPKQVEVFITATALGNISFVLRDLAASREAAEAEAAVNGPAAIGLKPGTYTNDVEVSPFMQAIASGVLEKQQKQERLLREQAAKAVADAQAAALAAEHKSKELTQQIEQQAEDQAQALAEAQAVPMVTKPIIQKEKKKKKKPAYIVEIYDAETDTTETIELK